MRLSVKESFLTYTKIMEEAFQKNNLTNKSIQYNNEEYQNLDDAMDEDDPIIFSDDEENMRDLVNDSELY
jgi:hypothetical protein